MNTTELTNDEKRAKIAEACGLFWHPEGQHEIDNSHQGDLRGIGYTLYRCKCGAYRFSTERNWSFDSDHREALDYLNDLNAMHEAEETLNEDQRSAYIGRLEGCMMSGPEEWDTTFATAAQRAEAFGRTLGLW